MTQKETNNLCVEMHYLLNNLIKEVPVDNVHRLHSCKAWVYTWTTDNGAVYALKSYETFVAVVAISGEYVTCADFLRAVYGYTATSAQHIAKFFSDYAPKSVERYRYYPVKERG